MYRTTPVARQRIDDSPPASEKKKNEQALLHWINTVHVLSFPVPDSEEPKFTLTIINKHMFTTNKTFTNTL